MTSTVFIAVLFAAFLHALWNSLIKDSEDKYVGTTAVAFGYAPISVVVILLAPSPDSDSWPYIISSILLHSGYMLFLSCSYRIGDLTQVYPVARGSAPLMVAGVSVAFLGVSLSSIEVISLLLITAGIMSLSLVQRADGLSNKKAVSFAFLTGCFIAAYSINDGLGARVSGTPVGYFAWIGLGVSLVWLVVTAIVRPDVFSLLPKRGKLAFLVGGNASFVAYVLVVWAFTEAPITLVSALRETSIIFALLIGVGVLKERLSLIKVVSTLITLVGATLLRFSK